MVVVQHQQLHKVLWGPAARDGRTKRSDVVVYVQLALVMALGVWQLYEFDKPAAMRLAACGAALLLYFRSVSLFVRLIMLLSFLMAYGDIFVPTKRALKASESFTLRHVLLLIYAQLLFNNGKIVWLVLRAMPGKQRKPLDARRSLIRKPKAA